MLDVDTFLTTLYVIVDDFCHSQSPRRRPGPEASLSKSEVITLAIFARWSRFASERDFYRYADTKLRDAFPTLPDRSQFNRRVRSCTERIEAFSPCPWRAFTRTHQSTLTKLWTARRCPSGTVSVEGADGSPATLTLVGPIVWDGMRAFVCSPPPILVGSSQASVSGPPLLPTSLWRRPSSTSGPIRTPDSKVWAWPSWELTLLTRALRAKKTTGAGWSATVQISSIRPSATPAREAGPNA